MDPYPYWNPRMQMDGMNPSTKEKKVKVKTKAKTKRGRSPEGMRRQRLRNELRRRAYEALLRLREGTVWDPERHEKITTKECWVSPFLWLCQGEVLTAPFYASPSWIRLRSLAKAYRRMEEGSKANFASLHGSDITGSWNEMNGTGLRV